MNMSPPRVYMSSQSWTLPPTSLPSGRFYVVCVLQYQQQQHRELSPGPWETAEGQSPILTEGYLPVAPS